MAEVNLTKENFDVEVLQADKPVLVDFWAAWCGPCQMLMPIVEEFAQTYDNIKVCKVNIDDVPDLAMRFKVMTIPTLIAFKNGEVIGKSVGVQPMEKILALFE